MFVGYQAAGTRGRSLVDGAQAVRIKGRDVPVEATIEHVDSMSAHADAGEIMRWLSGFVAAPTMTYLVHGEPVALDALRDRVTGEKDWPVHVAGYQERVDI
jgi:metallo-beta-lactamase family protein